MHNFETYFYYLSVCTVHACEHVHVHGVSVEAETSEPLDLEVTELGAA